jgi:deoxyribonuclease-4
MARPGTLIRSPGKRPDRLRFSVAGVPASSRGTDPAAGVQRVAELKLDAMELEFVHGVRIRDEMAGRVRDLATRLDVALTCHGPYYINLNSDDADKKQASIIRILDTARAAQKTGARSITFHAAFYLKQDPERVHRTVRESLTHIVSTLRAEGNAVQVRPELTGKPTQYGDLEELLRLSVEVEGVLPCIDFSHLYARTAGGFNSYDDIMRVLERYAEVLGTESLADMHLHASGIEFTPKGERRHLRLSESKYRYKELLRALKTAQVKGVLVCESPIQEEDSLLMKRSFGRLGTR